MMLDPPPEPHVLFPPLTIVVGPTWNCAGTRGSKLAFSLTYVASFTPGVAAVCRLVPPTPVTLGSDAEFSTPLTKFVPFVGLLSKATDVHGTAPLSPELARKVIPCALPCWNSEWNILRVLVKSTPPLAAAVKSS